MTPIRNQVLVKPFPADEISEGGIFVPESARKVSNKVKIVSVGGGTNARPMKLKTGQTGYRVQGWGCDILVDGELHFIMDMDAIIAVS
jgi:chaperonin GroES